MVYKTISRIPRGKVSTYKQVAVALKRPQAARAVGNALNHNPFAPEVPCHRVIKSNGELGGYGGGIKKKITLLQKEKVAIVKKQIDLKKYLHRFK